MKDQQTTTLPAEWFAVMSEGQAYAAYPRKTLAEAYACGFSRSCEIIPFRVLGAPPPAAPSPTDPKACLRELVRIGRHTPSDLPFNQYDQWTEARQIEVLARFVAGLPFAPPEGWEPAIGPQGTTTEWRNGEERPISHRAFAEPIPTAAAPSRSTPATQTDNEVLDFLVAYHVFPDRATALRMAPEAIFDQVKLIQSWVTLR